MFVATGIAGEPTSLSQANIKSTVRFLIKYVAIYMLNKTLLCLAAILLCSLLPYLNSIQGELVHDDKFAILENPDIVGEFDIKSIFTNDFWGTPIHSPKSHKSYRPLTVLTFKLNYYLHELSPHGYHILNIIIHSVNSLLIFLISLSYIFSGNLLLSLSSACLFASHPIHTEAVAGVVGRAELLACLAFLVTLTLYLHLCLTAHRNASHFSYPYQLSVLMLVGVMTGVSTLCKENGVTVLGVCPLIDIAIYSRDSIKMAYRDIVKLDIAKAINSCRLFLLRCLCVCVYLVLIISLRLLVQGGELPAFIDEDNPASFSAPLTKFLSYNYIYYVNALLMVMPSKLSYDWQMGSIPLVHQFSDVRNTFSLLLWAILIGYALRLSYYWTKSVGASHNPIFYSLILLVLSFIPSCNIFLRVGFVIAERVLYIPSIGLCICIPFGFNLILSKLKIPKIYLLSLFLLVILFSLKTYQRNKVWQNRESLFLSGIRDMPHNAKTHYNYANFLRDSLRNTDAITHYREAIALWPSHASSHNNLGTLLSGEEAIQHFRSAIKFKPTHSRALFNLGNRLAGEERYSEAIEAYHSSLQLDNSSSDCWLSLSAALIKTRAPREDVLLSLHTAEATATRSLTQLTSLAQLFLDTGDRLKAKHYYSECIGEIGSYVTEGSEHCYVGLASVHRAMGELARAEQLFEQTIQLFPDYNAARTTFGSFLYNTDRTDRAIELYRAAFDKQPIQSEEIISNFVQMLLKKDLMVDARSLVQTHFTSDTYSPNLLKLLVQIEIADRQNRTALDLLTQHSSLVQGRGELLFYKATALRNLNRYTDSLSAYQSILVNDPNNAKVLHDMGAIHHIMGRHREAREYYERALSLAPNDTLIKQNIQKLKNQFP